MPDCCQTLSIENQSCYSAQCHRCTDRTQRAIAAMASQPTTAATGKDESAANTQTQTVATTTAQALQVSLGAGASSSSQSLVAVTSSTSNVTNPQNSDEEETTCLGSFTRGLKEALIADGTWQVSLCYVELLATHVLLDRLHFDCSAEYCARLAYCNTFVVGMGRWCSQSSKSWEEREQQSRGWRPCSRSYW